MEIEITVRTSSGERIFHAVSHSVEMASAELGRFERMAEKLKEDEGFEGDVIWPSILYLAACITPCTTTQMVADGLDEA